MENIKIIVSHNYDPMPQAAEEYSRNDGVYVHIAASSSLQKDGLSDWAKKNFIFDNDCPKSIPGLNFTYCELASLYAGASLKEVLEADYIGLCHYRRLFSISQVQTCIEMHKPDIICSQPEGIGRGWQKPGKAGIKAHYELAHVKEDFDLLEGHIKESFVHQLKPATYDVWSNLPVLVAPCNCFVMKKDVFLDYTSRLFRVLEDIWQKRKDDIVKRDNYQRRAIGFLGERFTSWYVTAQHYLGKSVAQLPMQCCKDWKPETAKDNRQC